MKYVNDFYIRVSFSTIFFFLVLIISVGRVYYEIVVQTFKGLIRKLAHSPLGC